jgi:NADPH-dependent 2,4-dienoyl-CoA reductase/sulfur reductase-like enzyme
VVTKRDAKPDDKLAKGEPNVDHLNVNPDAQETAWQGPWAQEPTGMAGDVRHATSCCIVGGGPAGAMLGLLLARKGERDLPARIIAFGIWPVHVDR